jgi:hypothetical protein
MESPVLQSIRKLIPELPERDIPICTKYLGIRDFDSLQDLVDSAIIKVKRDRKKTEPRYPHINIDNLNRLSMLITDYASKL